MSLLLQELVLSAFRFFEIVFVTEAALEACDLVEAQVLARCHELCCVCFELTGLSVPMSSLRRRVPE